LARPRRVSEWRPKPAQPPHAPRVRRWGWPILIGVLAAAGILLAVGDIAIGSKWPNPLAQVIVGPVGIERRAPVTDPQTVRFDRSQIGRRFAFPSPFGGVPVDPYQALRAFLTNGAGLVLFALAALVIFPART